MKRASEVPPVVESLGLPPVTASMAPATSSTNGPGCATKELAFDGSQSTCQRMLLPAASAAMRSTSAFRDSWLCRSLKRMLKRARAARRE